MIGLEFKAAKNILRLSRLQDVFDPVYLLIS
jgi:hypothetical protein